MIDELPERASDHSHSPLSSWDNSSGPCLGSWLGVTCDPSTRRVTRLFLENLGLAGDLHPLGWLTELRILSLKINRFSSFPIDLSLWPNLKQLHLSHNEFSGEFPHGIGRLRRLRRVNLSHNNFSGKIPLRELSRLPRLLTLRLEHNSFVGALSPANLSTSISDFNVSDNQLTGEIPAWLSRFPATAYAGNKDLCGKPMPCNCSHHKEITQPEEKPSAVSAPKMRHSRDRTKLLAFIAVDAAAVLGAIMTITWCCCKNRRNSGSASKGGPGVAWGILDRALWDRSAISIKNSDCQGEMVAFEGCRGFHQVEDLLQASAELLGKGNVGTTYKVVVEGSKGAAGGTVLVVKRVKLGRWQGARRRREINNRLKIIGKLRHPNLVSLRACCHSMEELLLVYDYLPNGSLYSLLHENRGPGRIPVDWSTRMKLASDIARGLAFLHQHSKAKLFHGHLTTSNIVIDHSGNALISDVGLALLFPAQPSNDPNQAPELNPKGHIGESNFYPKYTQHFDVSSFGVVLLEILTGKAAMGEGETSLVNWVSQVSERRGSGKDVFDFEVFLSGEREVVEAEMAAVLQVAQLCLTSAPGDRPKMGTIYRMIKDIKENGGSEGLANNALDGLSSDSSPAISESAS
ncbi:hypothetical protein CRG98_008928 [Punica granatum]|uniref:Protein kinase domain-containing protein n=1 Tax=Punica granatum TaxID=22663 RepID=A0A2I0KQB8_PUNGR|nr:hypothetical protein CRG98_008928 [Punica granatum]